MGYRSEVGIVAEKKAYEMIKTAVSKVNIKYCKPDMEYETDDGHYFMYWQYTKWYSEFDDVRAIEMTLDELDEKKIEGRWDAEDGYEYGFLRIGDDYSDIEERSNGCLYLPMIRSIERPERKVD